MLETSPTIVGIHHIQMEAPPGCEEAARTFYSDILIALTEDEPLPGWSRFYITDPWGNRIELLERTEQ